jgi:TrmH family RNA methyltransferase
MPDISSTQNPRIKALLALDKPRERRKQGLFTIEGIREVSLAMEAGFDIESLYLCEALLRPDPAYPIRLANFSAKTITVSQDVFSRIAYRGDSGGVVAVAKWRPAALHHLAKADANSLYLVLEKVEKPGNIGAILRTADAAGVTAVIVCDPATDFYNPNVVRSSLGTLFTVPVAAAENAETLEWLKSEGVTCYAAALTPNAIRYDGHTYRGPTAFILGAESKGLSDFWLMQSHAQVVVPMAGRIDSMNVSNAAAVLVYEAVRQRYAIRNQ